MIWPWPSECAFGSSTLFWLHVDIWQPLPGHVQTACISQSFNLSDIYHIILVMMYKWYIVISKAPRLLQSLAPVLPSNQACAGTTTNRKKRSMGQKGLCSNPIVHPPAVRSGGEHEGLYSIPIVWITT